jgi:magnesium transporter
VTVTPDTTVESALVRANADRAENVYVVDEDAVLCGRLRVDRVANRGTETVREVMAEGPGTVRADVDAADLLERMRARDLAEVPVTDPEGRLLGVIRRTDLDASLSN